MIVKIETVRPAQSVGVIVRLLDGSDSDDKFSSVARESLIWWGLIDEVQLFYHTRELLARAEVLDSDGIALVFYCPYVPLQMVRAVDTGTFQPKIGFKTRYGLVANPFAEGATQGLGAINAKSNLYYRAFKIANLM